MKPNFISEEEFAEMVKGMGKRVKGGVENTTMILAKRQDGGGAAREEMPASDVNVTRKRTNVVAGGAIPPTRESSQGSTAARNSLKPVSNPAPSPTMQSFFVPGPLPGQNTFLGNGNRWIYGKAKKQWRVLIGLAIHKHRLRPMQRVHITWAWVERNKRRDPDNFTGISKKFILDTLVSTGILPDDGWDEIAGWTDRWRIDPDVSGVWVTLEERHIS